MRMGGKIRFNIFLHFVLAVCPTYLIHYPRNARKGEAKNDRKNDNAKPTEKRQDKGRALG